MVTDTRFTSCAIRIGGTSAVQATRSVEEVAKFVRRTVAVIATVRRELALAENAFASRRTIGGRVALPRDQDALSVLTTLGRVTIQVVEALVLTWLALAVSTLEASRTVEVVHTLGTARLAGSVLTHFTERAIRVVDAHDVGDALLVDAKFVGSAIGIDITLTDGLTLEVQTAFARAAVGVELTVDWDTETEFAKLTVWTIRINGTLIRWNWETLSSHASEAAQTFCIGLTAVWCLTNVVVTNHAR